jgi:hypothetical protein
MNGQAKENKDIARHRVITMLERKEVEFLDKLNKDAMFSTGHRFAYSEILKGLVDLAMETGVSGEKVSSTEAFKEKLLQQIRQLMQEEEAKKGTVPEGDCPRQKEG